LKLLILKNEEAMFGVKMISDSQYIQSNES